MTTIDILSEFVSVEREQYDTVDGNLFAFSLGQAARYYEFISIIAERYRAVSEEWTSSLQLLQSKFSDGARVMSDEEMALWEENRRLSTLVHLEIESFYVFAKVLLDKIALFVENYFGQARGCLLASHDKLTKNHERFRSAKELVYPAGFAESLTFLKEHICDYRDKQISHLRNPRTIKATLFNLRDGDQTRIATTYIYPSERDLERGQVESVNLSELIRAIDEYIQQVIEVISLNRSRTRFSIREQ